MAKRKNVNIRIDFLGDWTGLVVGTGEVRMDKVVDARLSRYTRNPAFWQRVGDYVNNRITDVLFERQVDQQDRPWAKLKPETIRRKKKTSFGRWWRWSTDIKGARNPNAKKRWEQGMKIYRGSKYPERVLYDSGLMQRPSSRIVKATVSSVSIRWNLDRVPYAKYHETGTRYMSARPSFNGLSEASQRHIYEIMADMWTKENNNV